jgi:hypothetical protein
MRGDPTDRAILNLEEEMTTLHQLISHLDEDSLRSNLDEMKKRHGRYFLGLRSPYPTLVFDSSIQASATCGLTSRSK